MRLFRFLLGGVALMGMVGFVGYELGVRGGERALRVLSPSVQEPVYPVFSHGLQSDEWFAKRYDELPVFDPSTCLTADTILLPHHLLVVKEIIQELRRISDLCRRESVKTVVIVSPNHLAIGRDPIQTTKGSWSTPFGELASNQKLVKSAVEAGVASEFDRTFETEHGVAALTPLVRKAFPEAQVISFVVSNNATQEEAEALGEWLHRSLKDAVVIASADISHEVPAYLAGFHDDLTESWIAQGGEPSLTPSLDAPRALQALFRYNQLEKTETWHRTFRDMAPQNDRWETESVTHLIGFFEAGEPTRDPFVSLLVVGDMMLDRGVREKLVEYGREYPWKRAKRLLSGVHLTMGNLEGTIGPEPTVHTPHDPPYDFVFDPVHAEQVAQHLDLVSLANNHSRDFGLKGERATRDYLDTWGLPWFGGWASPVPVYEVEIDGMPLTFVGYHQFAPALDELDRVLDEAQARGRFAIVYPHWGEEYREKPDPNQRALATRMIEHGADLVIGGHPHVPQAWDVIDGVPVVWSLGNFIFDQRIPETWRALTVGVRVTSEDVELTFVPIASKDGQPALLSDAVAQAMIRDLTKRTTTQLETRTDGTFRLLVKRKAAPVQ